MKKVVLTLSVILAVIVLVLFVLQPQPSPTLPVQASPTRAVSESIATRPGAGESTPIPATAESMPIPATADGPIGPPLVWLIVADEEILATTLGYSNASVSVEPIDLPPDLPPITLPAGAQVTVRIGSRGIKEVQARVPPRTTPYDQVFNAPILPLAGEAQFEGNQTLFTLGPINEPGDLRLDIVVTFFSDKRGSAHYAWPLHITPAPAVEVVNLDQLPSIPHDLLFLDQENLMSWNHTGLETDLGSLMRWNHKSGQLEALSSNVTCYWVSTDRRKAILEIAKGGDIYEMSLWDLASGRQTSLVETASRVIDLAISPDGKWAAYIQSETLPDEWYCKPDLVNFDMYPLMHGGSFSGTIYALRLGASEANTPGPPVKVGYCGRRQAPGLCNHVLWSPDSRSFLWSDIEGVWSFELDPWQARLIIPQTQNQPDFSDNRIYFPWQWSPSGRYILTALIIYEGLSQVVLDTQTGQVAEVPGAFGYTYPGSKPAWMADGRLFTIRPPFPSDYPDASSPAIEIWRVDPQQPGMLSLESSFLLDLAWDQVPTGDKAQLEDGRLAFAILSRESGDNPVRGLYFADPVSLVPRKANALPPPLSEFFYFETGILWSPDGQGAILQDWSDYPRLLYAPTNGSAVYDLSLVIQGCCFTWLR